MSVSKKIFAIMKEKGITQLELAQKTGIGQSTISDWKTKGTDPSSKYIMPICEALECTPYEILCDNRKEVG